MITHPQLDAALKRRGIHRSAEEISAILNELQPNPVSGFSCGGVQVWGDSQSIDAVKKWHHEADATVPALRSRLSETSVPTKAIELAVQYGGIDGAHHKAWVIDQMVRVLAGDEYEQIVTDAKAGEDGPDTYEWDEGIAP